MNLRKTLGAIKRILLFDDAKAVRKYSVTKTALELARLRNEVQGYLAELESDFSEQESRTFKYAQMEPQNRFVTEVLKQTDRFLEKYDRCRELFLHGDLVQYGRERDETLRDGRDLLNEIEATANKLPASMGYGGV
jgi:hypothetical protein